MEAYRFTLEAFEGPLDLLLHLVRQSEIDIRDIFVSEITAQYLEYMRALDTVDMERASEFLTMAATLLYIKSRLLLPQPEKEPSEGEVPEESPEEQLIRQLKDYEAFKKAGMALETRFNEMRDSFERLPEDVSLPPQRIDFKDTDAGLLYTAFRGLMERKERVKEITKLHRVDPDRFTVRSQLSRIRDRLRGHRGEIGFETLFPDDADKLEIIVTFMALLEMIAHGEISLKQPAPFEPIRITEKKLLLDDASLSYMDEEEETQS